MAVNIDIFLVGNDLYIDLIVGDFDLSISDEQHIMDNITDFPGWWKESPSDGVGIFAYQNSSGQQQILSRTIKQQLQSDGYQCNNPIVKQQPGGLLEVTPNAYKA